MKSWLPFVVLCVFASLTAVTKEGKSARKPNNGTEPFEQVQLCDGTAALGNEGGSTSASALINLFSDPENQKKCELALAFQYSYGNNRGLKLGRHQMFSVMPVQLGKTECELKEGPKLIGKGGKTTTLISVTVKGEVIVDGKPSESQVLIKDCKVTSTGY